MRKHPLKILLMCAIALLGGLLAFGGKKEEPVPAEKTFNHQQWQGYWVN